MSVFVCPVCGQPLKREEKSLCCPAGHSFDLARSGYVNLLRSNQSSDKRHGDDKLMIAARRRFLERGHYALLADAVAACACRCADSAPVVLDAGCGECWYTLRVKDALEAAGKTPRVCGIDISKEALIYGAKRGGGLELAEGSIAHLPVADGACSVMLNLFAPCVPAEFARALRPGGLLIRAIPLEEHLMGLKARVYEKPYANKIPDLTLPGFELVERLDRRGVLKLTDNADIQDLFMMTPYYYKTGAADQEKLRNLQELETEIAFGVLVYCRSEAAE